MASKRQQHRRDLYLSPAVPSEYAIEQLLKAHSRPQELLRQLLKASVVDAIDRGLIEPAKCPSLSAEALAVGAARGICDTIDTRCFGDSNSGGIWSSCS